MKAIQSQIPQRLLVRKPEIEDPRIQYSKSIKKAKKCRKQVSMDIIFSGIGVIIGGTITFLVARYYYQRATKDLKKEATKLRELNTLILRGMEESGQVKWNKDNEGNIVGLVINFKATSAEHSVIAEKVEVKVDPKKP
jgi:hypothetical protein